LIGSAIDQNRCAPAAFDQSRELAPIRAVLGAFLQADKTEIAK